MDKIQFGKYGIVFFCSFGVPRKYSGIAYGPIVFILPEYRNDMEEKPYGLQTPCKQPPLEEED